MNLGETIKRLRKENGTSQKDFAAVCEITPSYLSQIEGNTKDPNLSTIKRISENLNVPIPILFFLSLDADDVYPDKREAFELVRKPVLAMVNEFFHQPRTF